MHDFYMLKDEFLFNIIVNWDYVQLRKVPEDDVRLTSTKEIIAKIQRKNNWGPGAQTETPKGDQEREHGEEMHLGADGDESTIQDHDVEDESRELVGDVEEQSKEPVAATT